MTDNEIIKALKCCCEIENMDCLQCPYYSVPPKDDCVIRKTRDVINLINRQKAEIERLNIRNKTLTAITKNYDWKFAKAKSEAIKEFAERLKEKRTISSLLTIGERMVKIGEIDNLVKEMTEVQE